MNLLGFFCFVWVFFKDSLCNPLLGGCLWWTKAVVMSLIPPFSLQECKWRVEITNSWCCAGVLSTGLPALECQKYCYSTSEQVQSIFNYLVASEAATLQLFHNGYQQLNAKGCTKLLLEHNAGLCGVKHPKKWPKPQKRKDVEKYIIILNILVKMQFFTSPVSFSYAFSTHC